MHRFWTIIITTSTTKYTRKATVNSFSELRDKITLTSYAIDLQMEDLVSVTVERRNSDS